MALIIEGESTCSLCDEILTEQQFRDGQVFCTSHFIADEKHPLWQYSDSCMHQHCFINWEHREEFVDLYNEELGPRGNRLSKTGQGEKYPSRPDQDESETESVSNDKLGELNFGRRGRYWEGNYSTPDGQWIHLSCFPGDDYKDFDFDLLATRMTQLEPNLGQLVQDGIRNAEVARPLSEEYWVQQLFATRDNQLRLKIRFPSHLEYLLHLDIGQNNMVAGARWELDVESLARDAQIDSTFRVFSTSIFPALKAMALRLKEQFPQFIIEPWFSGDHDFMHFSVEAGVDCYLPDTAKGEFYNLDFVILVADLQRTPEFRLARIAWCGPEVRSVFELTETPQLSSLDLLEGLVPRFGEVEAQLIQALTDGPPTCPDPGA